MPANPNSALFLLTAMFIAATCSCSLISNAGAQEGSGPPPLIILVRHAEKASDPSDDPPLSLAGMARARVLATALHDAGVTAIITTKYRRTKETAQPLADESRVTPERPTQDDPGDLGTHVAAVVAAVRRHVGETVVVIGHTTTIPPIIAALGGPATTKICESSYGHLFVIASVMGKVRMMQSRYGAADPLPQSDCQ